MGFFDNIFSAFTGDPAKEAAQQNAQLYQQYGQTAPAALQQGLTPAVGALEQARAGYAPLSALGKKYGAGTNLYLGALGARGPEGVTEAQQAFTTGPGYQFAVNEATDAAARNAAKLGLAGSGNALDAIRGRAQGVAQQEYNNWLSNLGGLVSPELVATGGAATGQAGALTNTANLYNTFGQNLANIQGNVTGGLAQSNQQQAQAQMAGSQNLWNTLAGLGKAAAGAAFGV